MLSKAALRSKLRTETIYSRLTFHAVRVALVRRETAVLTERRFLAPNCVFRRSEFCSSTLESLSVIRRSRTFARVFSRAIRR